MRDTDGYGEVIQIHKLFNEKGITQIQQRIDTFEHLRDSPHYSWNDIKQFYIRPKNKITW